MSALARGTYNVSTATYNEWRAMCVSVRVRVCVCVCVCSYAVGASLAPLRRVHTS